MKAPKRPAMNEPTEWLKVMLGEIDRKRAEAAEAERERARRAQSRLSRAGRIHSAT